MGSVSPGAYSPSAASPCYNPPSLSGGASSSGSSPGIPGAKHKAAAYNPASPAYYEGQQVASFEPIKEESKNEDNDD